MISGLVESLGMRPIASIKLESIVQGDVKGNPQSIIAKIQTKWKENRTLTHSKWHKGAAKHTWCRFQDSL